MLAYCDSLLRFPPFEIMACLISLAFVFGICVLVFLQDIKHTFACVYSVLWKWMSFLSLRFSGYCIICITSFIDSCLTTLSVPGAVTRVHCIACHCHLQTLSICDIWTGGEGVLGMIWKLHVLQAKQVVCYF